MERTSIFNDITSVVNAMKNWISVRSNSATLTSLLSAGNGFTIQINADLSQAQHVHIYVGVVANQVYFFALPDYLDTANVSIADIAIASLVPLSDGPCSSYSKEISEEVSIGNTSACQRINNWKNSYASWLKLAVAQPNGVFEGMVAPVGDFTSGVSLDCYLALKGAGIANYTAELIVWHDQNAPIYKLKAFYDTVRPVPPFGGGNFYLYSQTGVSELRTNS